MWIHYESDGDLRVLNMGQVTKFELQHEVCQIVFFGQPCSDSDYGEPQDTIIEQMGFMDIEDAKKCFLSIVNALHASKTVIRIEHKFKGFDPEMFSKVLN
jgi:hypothetical protein